MNENHLEEACLEWLQAHGYEVLTGDDVSPGGAHEGRSKFSEVVLADRLHAAIQRLNPDLSGDEVDQAVALLAGYSNQSLIDANKEIYDWLRNGAPVSLV